jgi:hypothetical protein
VNGLPEGNRKRPRSTRRPLGMHKAFNDVLLWPEKADQTRARRRYMDDSQLLIWLFDDDATLRTDEQGL